jgi:prepilin-type N-terminal cleavage/methylation domain-containing protein
MKTQRISCLKRGFTLMELMVAMAITTIIVTVLVSITSIAIDTWNRSRSELRAARQAKAMVDTMARDFESLVIRRGNENEWLSATSPQTLPGKSTNASELIFYSASTDRYNGDIGKTNDLGGDVSCVAYLLDYRNPIDKSNSGFETFVLNRLLVDPKPTFDNLLGKPVLTTAFSSYRSELEKSENFVCENVFQFAVTFFVEVNQGTGASATVVTVPVTVGQSATVKVTKSLKIKGSGIEAEVSSTSVTADELKAGRIKAMEISLTVLSDAGVDLIRRTPSIAEKPEFMAKNSYQYSKLVQLPGM